MRTFDLIKFFFQKFNLLGLYDLRKESSKQFNKVGMAPIWYCHALILWAPKSWIWGLLYVVLLVSVLVLVFFRILKRLDIGGCAGLLLLLLPQKSRAFLPNFSSEVVEVKQVKFLKKKLFRSNLWISWMYRYHFYDLKEHFWWPNKCLKYIISSLNTL